MVNAFAQTVARKPASGAYEIGKSIAQAALFLTSMLIGDGAGNRDAVPSCGCGVGIQNYRLASRQ